MDLKTGAVAPNLSFTLKAVSALSKAVARRPGSQVSRNQMTARPKEANTEDWQARLQDALESGGSTDLVGVGNSLRSDDAVGLEIASELRSRLGAAPARGVRIHSPSLMPERLLSKLASKEGRIIVFDAVEASKPPGEIVCSKLGETKYGYFATHNVPLRLIPGLSDRQQDVFVVGVQPQSLEVGEGLTDIVRDSATRVAAAVTKAVEERI